MILSKKCIIYSAFGHRCMEEAFLSAKVTRKITKDKIDLVLHTDTAVDNDGSFNEIFVTKKPDSFNGKPYAFRIQGMIDICKNFNFDQFLYLDTDAFIKKPEALEIFQLLNQFDIAVAHAPIRSVAHEKDVLVPDSFPEFNCGVILFDQKSIPAFKEWLNLYLADTVKHPHDQGAFRRVLYLSNLRIATLTPEYNYRQNKGNAIIIHNTEQLKSIV